MKIGEDGLSQQIVDPKINSILNSVENCPSCLEFLPKKSTECPSCGIVLAHFQRVSLEKRIKISIPALTHLSSFECEELDKQWSQLESLFHHRDLHDRFLQFCYSRRALPYVVSMYHQRWTNDPSDDVAHWMWKRARTLAEAQGTVYPDEVFQDHLWSRSVMKLFVYVLYFSFFVGVFIAVFSLSPVLESRNLILSGLLCTSSSIALYILRKRYADTF